LNVYVFVGVKPLRKGVVGRLSDMVRVVGPHELIFEGKKPIRKSFPQQPEEEKVSSNLLSNLCLVDSVGSS